MNSQEKDPPAPAETRCRWCRAYLTAIDFCEKEVCRKCYDLLKRAGIKEKEIFFPPESAKDTNKDDFSNRNDKGNSPE